MLGIVIALSATFFAQNLLAERIKSMQQTVSLDHDNAHRYAAAWAALDHDDIARLNGSEKDFYGTLGSLEFQYSDKDRVLHVWTFVMAGAGSLLADGVQMKTNLDRIAQQEPDQTAGAIFDIRTLNWNKQASPKLEPCLYLRLDLVDGTLPVDQAMKKFKELSRAGYIWHRQKILDAFRVYFKDRAKLAK